MSGLPVREVRVRESGVVCVINESDFDPLIHEDPSPDPKPVPRGAQRKGKRKGGKR